MSDSNNLHPAGKIYLVLVTGATGFVGRYLCSLLVKNGYQVRGTYRNSLPVNFPCQVDWHKLDNIGIDTDWSKAIANVDYVVHLAALAHQLGPQGEGRFDEFMAINADGTRKLAEAIRASATIKRLIFISSIGAVKSLSDEVITEQTGCEPDTDYGKSKLAAELALKESLHSSSVDWCILRPPLVYGPGNPGNMARLLKLISTGLPLPFAAIKNQRSFVFVGNLSAAIERCLWHPGASRRIFLVSDDISISTPDLLRLLATISNRSPRLFALPSTWLYCLGWIGDVISHFIKQPIGIDSYSISRLLGSLYVDSTVINKALNWQPPFTLENGIKTTLKK